MSVFSDALNTPECDMDGSILLGELCIVWWVLVAFGTFPCCCCCCLLLLCVRRRRRRQTQDKGEAHTFATISDTAVSAPRARGYSVGGLRSSLVHVDVGSTALPPAPTGVLELQVNRRVLSVVEHAPPVLAAGASSRELELGAKILNALDIQPQCG